MPEFRLTSAPSRGGWTREDETSAMMAWSGEPGLLEYLENARRTGTRRWGDVDQLLGGEEPTGSRLVA